MSRQIQTVPVSFANTGIIIKSVPDEIPMTSYKMLSNAQTDRENTVSVRKGFVRLNSGLPNPPYSAYYLKDYAGYRWRYAITDGQLYTAPIEDPADASVWPLAAGTDFGTVVGGSGLSDADDPRALFTTFSLIGGEMKPYMFMADGTAFLKHSGGMASARRVGIPRPANPITDAVLYDIDDIVLEECEDYTQWISGDSTVTTAQDYPSAWFYGTSQVETARWIWVRYTFTLDDTSETYASEAYLPHYIAAGKKANLFWKPYIFSYSLSSYYPVSAYGTYFNDGAPNPPPPGARLRGVRLLADDDYIYRLQALWELPDGTTQDAPHHGGARGTEYTFILDFDEYITEVKGKFGSTWMHSVVFVTNKRESQIYGEDRSGNSFSLTVPDPTATSNYSFIGFAGKSNGDTKYQHIISQIALVFREDTYDNSATPPGNADYWNAYVGDSPTNTFLVASNVGLSDIYQEPANGFETTVIRPPLANVGDLSEDGSGHTTKAIMMSLTGSGVYGKATKILTDALGYPIVKDLGGFYNDESFSIWIKFADAEALANVESLSLSFVISDLAGDTGDKYNYMATATKSDFSGWSAGVWTEIVFTKEEFVFTNYGSGLPTGLDWHTVTAINVEVIVIDPATGGETCNVSFDDIVYQPLGHLTGVDYQWTYTYYNTKTNTESDFADFFECPFGALSNAAVELSFPITPLTNPPLANPDKIRIYRLGGTVSDFQLVGEIDYVPGFTFTFIDNIPDSELGAVMERDNQLPVDGPEGCEIYDNRLWTWGGSENGIKDPSNRLRFSKGTRVELFPADNYIQVGSGNEQIMRVYEHDGELFVFTLTRIYRIVGQDPSTYRAVSTPVNQGLTNKHCVTRGAHGLFMRAYDGIYEFPSGRKISESINQVFFGQKVNGVDPVASGREIHEAMSFYDSKLFFSYAASEDTDIDNDRTLIWDIIYERWSWYIYGAQELFFEPETNILVGCNVTQTFDIIEGVPSDVRYSGNYPMQLETGFYDQCSDSNYGIPCVIDTREYDLGFPDQEKQFIDLTVDADTQGYPITVLAKFDNNNFDTLGVVQTADRDRVVLPVVLGDGDSRFAVRMSLRISFESDVNATSSTRIYKIAHRFLLEPERHGIHVTDWSEYGSPGPKYFHKLWVEMDTGGYPLESIEVQIDQSANSVTIEDNIVADGRQKIYYGLGIDVRGTLARLKFTNDGEHDFKIYDHGFEFIPEPPLMNTWQNPWTDNSFPYKKLWKHIEFDIDTDNKLIDFDFWLDGEISQSFQITTNGRRHVIQSLDQEQFGRLGRVTVDVPLLGSDGLPQGVRAYAPPLYVVEERNPEVTIADSFERVIDNIRLKVLRRIWHVIDNPNSEVTLRIYVDNELKFTTTIASTEDVTPKLQERRIDMPSGLKGRIMRFVFTSTQEFEIDWQKCQFLLRDVNTEDGYRPPTLPPPATY